MTDATTKALRAIIPIARAASNRTSGKEDAIRQAKAALSKSEDPTSAMVRGFADAVKDKIRAANDKYGHSLIWRDDPNFDGMRRELREHMEKGDPLDVAAYCAFLWYHSEPTAVTGEP